MDIRLDGGDPWKSQGDSGMILTPKSSLFCWFIFVRKSLCCCWYQNLPPPIIIEKTPLKINMKHKQSTICKGKSSWKASIIVFHVNFWGWNPEKQETSGNHTSSPTLLGTSQIWAACLDKPWLEISMPQTAEDKSQKPRAYLHMYFGDTYMICITLGIQSYSQLRGVFHHLQNAC